MTIEYFRLETEGDLRDESLCLVADPPEGMGINYYRLGRGKKADAYFPTDARISLRDVYPGIRLAGVMGNLCGFLILSKEAKEIVENLCADSKIEYFPFTLYNHKGRIHTREYFFVNPLGGFDCVSDKASQIQYAADGEILVIEKLVLSDEKLQKAPHLFRIDKDLGVYVISGTLRDAFASHGITNVLTTPFEIEKDKSTALGQY